VREVGDRHEVDPLDVPDDRDALDAALVLSLGRWRAQSASATIEPTRSPSVRSREYMTAA